MRSGGRGTAARVAVVLAAIATPCTAGDPPAAVKPFVVASDGGGDAKTIADALARAPAGTPIAVRAGVYGEMLAPARAVEIRAEPGAKEVVVEGPAGPALRVAVPGVVVGGLSFRLKGPGAAGAEAVVVVEEGGAATLENCAITGDHGSGVRIRGTGAKATLVGCRIEAVPLDGVTVDGAKVFLERTSIEGAKRYGIGLFDGAVLRGQGVTVTACDIGVRAEEGASVGLEGGRITACAWGVLGVGVQTSIVLKSLGVTDGKGIAVSGREGAQLEIVGCELSAVAGTGIDAEGAGGKAVVRTCKIHDNKGSGILFDGLVSAVVEDCDIAASQLVGIEVRNGGEVSIRRCKVHGHKTGSDVAVHDRSTVRMEDCELWGATVPEPRAWAAGQVELKGGVVHDGGDDGVLGEDKATIRLTGVEIRNNKGNGIWGSAATVIGRECKIRKNGGFGVRVSQDGGGSFEKCRLTDNVAGAWKLEDVGKVLRKGNTPQE